MLVNQKNTKSLTKIDAAMASRYSRAAANTFLGHLWTLHADLYRRAFHGRDYTTAEFFAQLGADGGEFLDLMESMVSIAEKFRPGAISPHQLAFPAGVDLSRNSDGTVTVG